MKTIYIVIYIYIYRTKVYIVYFGIKIIPSSDVIVFLEVNEENQDLLSMV